MKSLRRKRLVFLLLSILSMMLFSLTALAQADINIDNENLIRVGGDVIVPPNQVVENALAVGGNVTIQEETRVTETAIAIGGDIILEKGVQIDGDAYAVGGEILAQEGVTIHGASGTVYENGRWRMHQTEGRKVDGFLVRYFFGTAFHLLNIAVGAVAGVLLLLWRPNFLLTLATLIRQAPLRSGLWGLGELIAVTVLIIVLAISLIGIPLLPLVGLAVAITALLGTLGVALWLGQRILKAEQSPISQFLLGMLILALIGLIPGLGGLVLSVVNIVGFGAILAWLMGDRQPPITA